MRYIDLDEIELDLPGDWDQKVEAAWAYVEGKMDDAEQSVRKKAQDADWDEEKTEQCVELVRVKARKKAISAKSSVWSALSDLLAEQSKGKCWYCETNEIRSDNPIDHFRPKNSVKECKDHPGYWWLAFTWNNYRYACTYCNSRRVEVETAGGKHDHFPLFTPPDWNRTEADRNVERPKLLDPTDIEDCKLLTFNKNGEACSINEDEKSEQFLRAEKSIELYHLNHKPTTRERRVIYQNIRNLVSETNELIEEGVAVNAATIKKNKKELIKLIRPSCKSTKFNTAAKLYLRQFEKNEWVNEILHRE